MRDIKFTSAAFAEYNEWIESDDEIFEKIKTLVKDISRDDPFKGLGKPEPLKGKYSGFWSRRISREHRLIYSVTKDAINIVRCKGHYLD